MAGLLDDYAYRGKGTREAAAGLLSLDPDVVHRSSLLPLVGMKDGSVELGYPEMVIDAARAFLAPGHAMRGGTVTNEDALNTVMTVGAGGLLAKRPVGSLGAFGDVGNIRGKHASPHKFDKFDLSKIGTGEGAQAYGHGGYLAEADAVVDQYFKKFTRNELSAPGSDGFDLYDEDSRMAFLEKFGNQIGVSKELPQEVKRLTFSHDVTDLVNEAFYEVGDDVDAAIDWLRRTSAEQVDKLKATYVPSETAKKVGAAYSDAAATLEKMKEAGLDRKVIPAHLYEVELDAQPHEMLDWDKPLSEQSKFVKSKLGYSRSAEEIDTLKAREKELRNRLDAQNKWSPDDLDNFDALFTTSAESEKISEELLTVLKDLEKSPEGLLRDLGLFRDSPHYGNKSGIDIYQDLVKAGNKDGAIGEHLGPNSPPMKRGDKWASQSLREKGIKGIRYLDGNSRGKGEGTYNYVFFDDKDALIHTRDGEPIKGLLSEGGDDAAKAAYKAEFGKDVYHGTHATDLQEFDPDMVDIGVHVGTQEQAANRLKSLSNPLSSGRSADYRSGANVLPLKARIENPLELPDVGLWNDSASVAKELNKRGLIDDEFLGEISEVKGQFEDLEDFIVSSENREFLDELRGAIEGAGYDSVKYKNLVENEYGDLTKMLPDARQRETAILEELRKYEDAILDTRRPKLPEDMSDKDGMRRFLDSSSNALDYATPEEAARIKELYGRAEKIRSNPASYADPHSYIVLDPANLRSRFAKFDPSKRDSGNLLAGIGAGGVVGGGALMAGGQEAEARPRNAEPIKELLAD